MSKKNKEKIRAFMNCEPKDIYLYIDSIPGVPKKEKLNVVDYINYFLE